MIHIFKPIFFEDIQLFDKKLFYLKEWSTDLTKTTKRIYEQRGQNGLDRMINQHAHSKMGEIYFEKFLKENNIKITKPVDFKIYCEEEMFKELRKTSKFNVEIKHKSFDYDLCSEKYNFHIKIQDEYSKNLLRVYSWMHQQQDTFLEKVIPEKDLSVLGYINPTERKIQFHWIIRTDQVVKHLLDAPIFKSRYSNKKSIYEESPSKEYRKNIKEKINEGLITPLSLEDLR
jgi:hypothetical protein